MVVVVVASTHHERKGNVRDLLCVLKRLCVQQLVAVGHLLRQLLHDAVYVLWGRGVLRDPSNPQANKSKQIENGAKGNGQAKPGTTVQHTRTNERSSE